MTAIYKNLRVAAYARLADLRARANQFNAKRPPSEHRTWRELRYSTFRNAGALGQGFNDKTPVWYSHAEGEQFRNERDAHDVIRLRHTGWFTDGEWQNELAIGIVAGLPHGRFIAGYRLTMNDERVYFPGVFTDESDAARMADEHARVIGEQESEQANKQSAAEKLSSEIEDAFTRLRECIALRHKACMSYVRDEISELVEAIRDKRKTLRTDYADCEV